MMLSVSTLLLNVLAWLAATPSPSASGVNLDDPAAVSPGLIGFLATFAVVIVTVFLIIDMSRRVRRINYRGDVNERQDP